MYQSFLVQSDVPFAFTPHSDNKPHKTFTGQRTRMRNKPCCCDRAEITCSLCLFCSYLQRRPLCWCCRRPGRRCWTGALPSVSQAWPEHGWLVPCATGAPGGHLLLHTGQHGLLTPPTSQFSLEQLFPN